MTSSVNGVYSGQTYTLTGSGLSATLHPEATPTRAPKALFLTRAVETQDGWVGQLLIDGDIVYQTNFIEDGREAVNRANNFLVERIKSLFVETIDGGEETPGDGPTWTVVEDEEQPTEEEPTEGTDE